MDCVLNFPASVMCNLSSCYNVQCLREFLLFLLSCLPNRYTSFMKPLRRILTHAQLIPAIFLLVASSVVSGNVYAGVNVNQLVNDSAPSIVQVQGVEWVKVKIPDKYKEITSDPVYQSLSSIFIDNPNITAQAAPVVKKRITGSGFIISSTGRIATNYQWIKGRHEVFVILADRRQFKARIIRTEPKNDLAILQIPATNLPAMGLARQVEEGEGVITVGANKKGISVGVIVSTPAQTPAIGLVSDASVNRDNSGGPLLNIYGQVLGVNSTQTRAPLGLYRHVSLSKLTSDSGSKATESINLLSQVGFSARNLDQAQSAALGLHNAAGAFVTQVRSGSLAATAGLQKNDVIVALETQSVVDSSDLNALTDFLRQDNQARIRVFRAGDFVELNINNYKVQDASLSWAWQRLGLRVRALTTAQKDLLNITSGVTVTELRGSAQQNGLATGDVLVSINQTPINTTMQLNQIAQKLNPDDTVALYVIRGETRQFITQTVGE